MADKVNEQISDSVNQVTVTTIGIAPAQAMATLYQTSSAAAAMALQNAVHAQNNQYAISNAVMVEAVNLVLSSPTAATAASAQQFETALNSVTKFSELLDRVGANKGGKSGG
ncbi:hypothetical protein PPSIR1_06476 [Plesiocystis pacifica SIR-1]|uniref:RebB like protein n=1 Tax=Plesiocystis pacifica SIR-1 TaxID=391625 RepID=A6GI05_9BACT|nr:RebB family R body protein [Plesiocystis pacifica]EDM74512.1 hypothetical protein PPSIR1_06476 [Plesiocystis pacifica SIR-1]